MFWQILSIENTKIIRRRMLWVVLVLMVLAVLAIQIVLYAAVENSLRGTAITSEDRANARQMITWPGALVSVLALSAGNALGGLFFVILVGAVTAQEYTWRTLHLWLSRGIPRLLLGGTKFIALLLPAILIVLAALLAGGGITAIISAQIEGSLHLNQMNFPQLFLSLLRTTCTLLPYGALTFLLAVVSRSTVVAISGGLAYALLIESVLAQMLGLLGKTFQQMTQYLPAVLSESLLAQNQAVVAVNSIPKNVPLAPWHAAFGIVVWTLLFLVLSLWIFQRQDLTE